jgi:hypothetical protein
MFNSYVEGAGVAKRGGKDECGYHVDVRFQIIKHNGNGELDSGAGDLTHTFASGISWGFPQFATCEVCLLFIFIYFGKKN